MRNLKNTFIAVLSVAVVGFTVSAFAYDGMGYGRHGRGNYGDGNCPGYYGQGYNSQLSPEELKQVQQEREAFFKETEGLRNDMFEKRNALQSELDKETPDVASASKLQKELSDLKAQLDQKRLDHIVKMKKINPNAGRGFMGQGGKHRGQMMGKGYGPGSGRGGGYCW